MSNERFELAYENDNWWAVNDSGITLWKEEVIYLLNKQDEYIKILEHYIIQNEIVDKKYEKFKEWYKKHPEYSTISDLFLEFEENLKDKNDSYLFGKTIEEICSTIKEDKIK